MKSNTKPQRVGALLSADETTVKFLGWGVLEGEFVPPAEVSPMLNELQIPNPRIKLDNGKTVWGCECWWGSESQIQSHLEGKTVTTVDIDEVRKEAAEK